MTGPWLSLSLVLTAMYGGSLRAIMLKPEVSSTIETLADVVNSGLPWHMVLYGENIEHHLATKEDEVTKRFWTEKRVVEYNEYPIELVRKIGP